MHGAHSSSEIGAMASRTLRSRFASPRSVVLLRMCASLCTFRSILQSLMLPPFVRLLHIRITVFAVAKVKLRDRS